MAAIAQLKQSNQLSLPQRNHCLTKYDSKQYSLKHKTPTNNGSNNNNRTAALEQTSAETLLFHI